MSFETEFLGFMPHTIVVYPMVSANQYAEEVHSTQGSTYRAMVEERPDVVRSAYGEEVVSSHIAYVASTERIDLSARVVLPDGSEPSLIRADIFYDEDGGIHHNALFFGSGASGG